MKYLKDNFPLFNLLFLVTIPLYFILDANNKYWALIPVSSSFKISLLVIASGLLLFAFFSRFFEQSKVVIIVIWLMINYLFFKPIMNFIISFRFLYFFSQYKFYLPFCFIVSLVLLHFLIRTKKKLKKLCFFLNSFFLVIFSFEIVFAVQNSMRYHAEAISTDKVEFTPLTNIHNPDVFLFILDEYAGTQSLIHNYNFDNETFNNQLRQKNFYIPLEPNCNYNSTVFSVLSLLDMGYLANVKKEEVKNVKAFSKAASGVQNNQLTRFFVENGYTFINNSFFKINHSKVAPTLFLPLADRLVTNKTLGDVLWYDLLSNIPSNSVQEILNTYESRTDYYNENVKQRVHNAIVSKRSSPVFVYSHFFMPHGPYLRNEDGTKRNFSQAHHEKGSRERDSAYLGYLKYTNNVMLDIVEKILDCKPNSIIIIVSDHGNRYKREPKLEKSDFNNYLAVYSPYNKLADLPDTVSLVNLFRVILNREFGQQLQLHESNHRIDVNGYLR